jgi:hypothetical protein
MPRQAPEDPDLTREIDQEKQHPDDQSREKSKDTEEVEREKEHPDK